MPEPVKYKGYVEFQEAFVNGEVDFMYASTGFWPLDPVGDIQMLFTPNMHEILDGIASDTKFREFLDKLDQPSIDNGAFEEINRYLYRDAYFNVYGHHARLYIQSKKLPNVSCLWASHLHLHG